MTPPDWQRLLDDYAASLADLRRWLDDGAVRGNPPSFEPPPAPGLLPAGLRDRAQALLAESTVLVDRVTRLSHQRARERAGLARQGNPRPPLFVDRSG